MHLSAVVFTVYFIGQALALKYTDCGSKTGQVLDVSLSGCEDSDVCELKRGETYSYTMQFTSLTDSENLKVVVHGIMGGISMPYPVPNSDACEGIDCPLQTGETYNYENEIEVKKSYPRVKADVKWELRDDNNQNVACVLIPVKIV